MGVRDHAERPTRIIGSIDAGLLHSGRVVHGGAEPRKIRLIIPKAIAASRQFSRPTHAQTASGEAREERSHEKGTAHLSATANWCPLRCPVTDYSGNLATAFIP
jgi:hypothetical protein